MDKKWTAIFMIKPNKNSHLAFKMKMIYYNLTLNNINKRCSKKNRIVLIQKALIKLSQKDSKYFVINLNLENLQNQLILMLNKTNPFQVKKMKILSF